jgi:hypothetical protein
MAIAIACFVVGRWPGLAVAALVAGVFCAISPRMKGPFGFSAGGGAKIGGEFDDPNRGQLELEVDEPLELAPHLPKPNKELDED